MSRASALLVLCWSGFVWGLEASAAPGDWPEPRQNAQLTAVQPLAGALHAAPREYARFDLGRGVPPLTGVQIPGEGALRALAVHAGTLYCFDASGAVAWMLHPQGLNFSEIVAVDDFDGSGKPEALLRAGRPTEPYAAAALVDAAEGRLLWRYDVEPMSYQWYLFAGAYLPGATDRQIIVLMQGYPPEPKNGYIALFAFEGNAAAPVQRWRHDFDQYTCYPVLLQADLEGDGARELAVVSHSRMWFLDAATGSVKHFVQWEVSPGNVRSYGLTRFLDLNGDGREDFLCIANFAQHHEVLLNRNGRLEEAWHQGWAESVTTGKVASVWPEPPQTDVDGDGDLEIVVSIFNGEGRPAWVTRIYDAVTGVIAQRIPDFVPVATTREGLILGNVCHDAARVRLGGARLLRPGAQGLETVWADDRAEARAPQPGSSLLIAREGALWSLALDSKGSASETPYVASSAPSPPLPPVAPLAGPPYPELLAAELSGDGVNDLLLYRNAEATVLVLRQHALEAAGSYASSVLPALGDVNGDGRTDLVTCTVAADQLPRVEARTPALGGAGLWQTTLPPADRPGLPQPRRAYLRTGKFSGVDTPDVYLWAGTPLARSAVLRGQDGAVQWEAGEAPGLERFWGPTMNLASVHDFDRDGAEDLVFTNPDYYCVASGRTGAALCGPLYPPEIFKQASQGLYTAPVLLLRADAEPLVALVSGHYFQGVMTLQGAARWHRIPATGEHSPGREGFLQAPGGAWLMGYGREDGRFVCVDGVDGRERWRLDLGASVSDVIACDVDGDGAQEFVFGTSHGMLHALGDGGAQPRPVWVADLGAAVGSPIAADVDGDGRSEIIVCTADGWLRVLGAAPAGV
jgi:hypothetical protein